jgi:O-antigen/teichoic acid export membrane protein
VIAHDGTRPRDVIFPDPSAAPGPTDGTPTTLPTVDLSPGHAVQRNILVLAGGQATTWTMTLLWTLVVPRLLGPAGMGLITSIWAVAAILGVVLGLGSQSYLTREVAARPSSAGHLVGSALVLRVIMAPVFVACAAAFAHFAHYGPDARLVLWLATGATLFTLLNDPLLSVFQARERMQYLAYSDVITRSTQGLVGIVIVVIGFGAVGLTAAWLAISIAVLVLSLRWIRPLVHIDMRTNLHRLTALARASVSYFALGLSNVIYTWIDSVMLSLLARQEVVGWYAAPTKVLGALLFIPVIISTAWAPRLVRAFESSEDELRTEARRPIELVMILAIPVCAATALAAQPLIPLLYGNAYQKSVPVMAILGFTAIPMYANIIFATVLVAMRRQARLTWLMAAAAVVNPALNFLLIRLTEHRYHNGAIGAAVCLLITELMIVAFELVFVGRRVLSASSLMRVLSATLASGGMWAVGYLARPLGWYVSLPLAGVIFLALAWLLRVASPEERAEIRSGIAKVASRVSRGRRAARTKR